MDAGCWMSITMSMDKIKIKETKKIYNDNHMLSFNSYNAMHTHTHMYTYEIFACTCVSMYVRGLHNIHTHIFICLYKICFDINGAILYGANISTFTCCHNSRDHICLTTTKKKKSHNDSHVFHSYSIVR